MELKWTGKALSDLARLYEFLAPVNQPAAARTVQQLTAAPTPHARAGTTTPVWHEAVENVATLLLRPTLSALRLPGALLGFPVAGSLASRCAGSTPALRL